MGQFCASCSTDLIIIYLQHVSNLVPLPPLRAPGVQAQECTCWRHHTFHTGVDSAGMATPLAKGDWVTEEIVPGWRQQMLVDEVMVEERNDLGHRAVFKNQALGDVLLIEDRIQLTSRDEHAYHEMFTHVPIVGHGKVKDVLIIGGGDGASLREVLKHRTLRVTLVDIDPGIIAFSKKFLPTLHREAWDDARATVVIADGSAFVVNTQDKFDVIIVDSTDPVPDGPSAVLYQVCVVAGGMGRGGGALRDS